MIRLFNATTKDFSSNGDVILKPVKCKVHHDEDFYLNIETSLQYADYMVQGAIIVAPTPQGSQAFRINNIEKTGTKITAKCPHVFYDTKNYLIQDSYVVEKNTNGALAWLNDATEPESPFVTFSDVPAVGSFRCVRESLYSAVKTVLERWGGYLYMDNFSISILQSIGSDNGITVRYRKNLREISVEEDWSNVVTKLLPVGKDGILLNAVDPNVPVYVTSQRQYDIPYCKTVSFEQDIEQDDYVTPTGEPDILAYQTALLEDLWTQAQSYLEENSVPKVNYTLKASIDRTVNLGDIIDVIDERLGIDIMTEVISYDYDCLTERITELEFGNYKPSLSGFNDQITAKVDQSVKTATDEIIGTMSDSYVVYNGSDILILDRLPKSTAVNVIKIGGSGGVSVSHSGIYGLYTPIISLDGMIGYDGHVEITQNGIATAFSGDVVTVSDVITMGYYENGVSFSVALPACVSGLDPVITALVANVKNLDGSYEVPYSADGNDLLSYVDSATLSDNLLTVKLTGISNFCVLDIKTLSVRLGV